MAGTPWLASLRRSLGPARARSAAGPASRGEADLGRTIRYSVADGFFASATDNLTGPFLPAYLLAFGATKLQVGLLSALPSFAANIIQLPGAKLTQRLPRRKPLCVWSGLAGRVMWVAVALAAFLPQPAAAVAAVILLTGLRAALGNLGVPGWTDWIADLVPREDRSSFFANRNIVATVGGLLGVGAGTLLVGCLRAPLAYQVCLFVASLTGTASVAFLYMMFEPARDRTGGTGSAKRPPDDGAPGALTAPAAGTATAGWFGAFCAASFVFMFGVNFGATQFPVFTIQKLGAPSYFLGVQTLVFAVVTIGAQRYWVRLGASHGLKLVMTASGLVATIVPVVFVLSPTPGWTLLSNIIGGAGWAGYNMAAFSLLLEMAPEDQRPSFVARFNTINGVALLAGPIMGGWLADVTRTELVLWISGAVRLAGWFMFRRSLPRASDMGWPLQRRPAPGSRVRSTLVAFFGE